MKLNKALISKNCIFQIEHPQYGELVYSISIDANSEAHGERLERSWNNSSDEELPSDVLFEVQDWLGEHNYFGKL